MSKVNVAVLGATGVVGEAAIQILEERNFPVGILYPLASTRSEGQTVLFRNRGHMVQDVADFDFSLAQIAIFSAGSEISKIYAPKAAKAGCVVIDNTAEFRQDSDVPLVVPEVNPEAVNLFRKKNIIANPNCSTVQLVLALKPIYDAVGITRVNIATYQSVSGAGKDGLAELAEQTGQLLNGLPITSRTFPVQIGFNLFPHIDDFLENGYTKEEMKLVLETQKILNDTSILVNPTAVRVPIFYGHSEAVHLETKDPISVAKVKELLQKAPGVKVVDNAKAKGYPTPVTHAADNDAVFVGRIRQDLSHPRGLDLWIVADNVRKGGALNAVQIAELLLPLLEA